MSINVVPLTKYNDIDNLDIRFSLQFIWFPKNINDCENPLNIFKMSVLFIIKRINCNFSSHHLNSYGYNF